MKYLAFIFSILCYFIGLGGLFYMILWMGDLLPFDQMHDQATQPLLPSILKNISLIVLFGLQHSIMARKSFKKKWTNVVSRHLERSIYVGLSGLICALIAWQWMPIEGVLWKFEAGSIGYYFTYAVFFTGILFLVASTFVINHFELFGLQQAYHNLKGKIAASQSFKEVLFYKYTRHPIYLGFVLILFSAPHMSMTRLTLAVGLLIYMFIGIAYEERDLLENFGDTYQSYKNRVPKIIPFIK